MQDVNGRADEVREITVSGRVVKVSVQTARGSVPVLMCHGVGLDQARWGEFRELIPRTTIAFDVDTYSASYHQDSCKPPGIRWVEPLIPVGSFVPVHPNNIGEAGMAWEVRRVFDAQGL